MNTDSIFFLTGASVQAVPLVNCAPEKSGASAWRRGSVLPAPPELLLHGDLQAEHGGHQEAAQRQGSLHLRVLTLYSTRYSALGEGVGRLTFVALIRRLLYRRRLAENHT